MIAGQADSSLPDVGMALFAFCAGELAGIRMAFGARFGRFCQTMPGGKLAGLDAVGERLGEFCSDRSQLPLVVGEDAGGNEGQGGPKAEEGLTGDQHLPK